jgi:hypothetical protein
VLPEQQLKYMSILMDFLLVVKRKFEDREGSSDVLQTRCLYGKIEAQLAKERGGNYEKVFFVTCVHCCSLIWMCQWHAAEDGGKRNPRAS